MNGAKEFSQLFKTAQYGRLYIVSGSHARGRTFHIYVLPADVSAQPNGPNNPPLNADAVEVYGVTGGQRGWTETYGWLFAGPWQADFYELVEARMAEIAEQEQRNAQSKQDREDAAKAKQVALLATY